MGLASVFGQGLVAAEEPKAVRVGGGFSVPWAYLAPDGSPTGFYVEVLKEAARREGLRYEAVFRSDGLAKSLRSGTIDVWAAAVPTEERRKQFYFTEPWWSQDHFLGVLQSSPIYGMNDLSGRVVVHGVTPPFTVKLIDVFPGAHLRAMEGLRPRFSAICDGRADAVLFYHETSLFAITGSDEMAACRERGLRLIPVPQPIMQIAIAALPENSAMADRLRARIREMARDQTLARLAEFPLTGNQNVVQMFQEERTDNRKRLMLISQIFTLIVLGVSGVAIFRLRRANQETRAALAEAEKALQVKRNFLATMSHEIRTPMTAVLGYMDMLLGTPLRPDQRRFAVEVSRATESLLTLMTTMLSYARPGEMQETDSDAVLNPAGVMDDCLAAVLLTAEAKGLAVTLEVDPQMPRFLRGNAVPLRQAILNLMTNAVKFTERGWVRLEVSYSDGVLICVVSDSGGGIPEASWKLIFEPFTQLDSSDKRSYGGVGLGLAVVADICQVLGGEINVDREPEGGSRFTLRIPYAAVQEEGLWLPAGASGSAVLLASGRTAVVILKRYLQHAGLMVHHVQTEEALQAWNPPVEGRVLCFVEGESFAAVPAWRNDRTVVILLASLNYLRDLDDTRKRDYDDILPMPASSRAVREILWPEAVASRSEHTQRGLRVMVVDDNAVNRRVLTVLLEKLGCTVDVASNGREAVELSLRQRYTVILMDCQMPLMNGFEATEEIRRLTGNVPICGVSASLDLETRRRCERSGMDEYMAKPLTLDMLEELLSRTAERTVPNEPVKNAG